MLAELLEAASSSPTEPGHLAGQAVQIQPAASEAQASEAVHGTSAGLVATSQTDGVRRSDRVRHPIRAALILLREPSDNL